MYLRSRLLVVYLRSAAVKKLIPIRIQLSTDQKRRWESSTLTLLLPQLLIFSYSVFSSFSVAEPIKLPPVKCNEPVLATVKVDPQHRVRPFYVRLHRCEGSWEEVNPKTKKCVALGIQHINIKVFSFETNRYEVRSVVNHTSCDAECTTGGPDKCDPYVERWNEDTCKCDCKFDDAPPSNIMKQKNHSRWELIYTVKPLLTCVLSGRLSNPSSPFIWHVFSCHLHQVSAVTP